MYDSAKYLIHADIRASGVVERSDVVGAVFGQTEGLLGDELDLRDLQESQQLGRIDVEVESEGGTSFGEITIESGLDKVETAILAAALESIERVGPCRADVEVAEIEDARSAKRRSVIDRASELLAEFDDETLTSRDLVEEVRQHVRVDAITDYRGLPAGPRVTDSDAIIVVEGRADVLTLLRYGVKNALAVEGTNVPDAVAELTRDRTVTAFLDGDRGGDLILRELAQVGEVDYVAVAPRDRSVEDLSRGEVMGALREKVPYEAIAAEGDSDLRAATDGSTRPAPSTVETPADDTSGPPGPGLAETPDAGGPDPGDQSDTDPATAGGATGAVGESSAPKGGPRDGETDDPSGGDPDDPSGETSAGTLTDHVEAVRDAGRVRLLDGSFEVLEDGPADEAFDFLEGSDAASATVVLDGELSQRVLDVAAQRGVDQIVARTEGEFVKQPTGVAIRTYADL